MNNLDMSRFLSGKMISETNLEVARVCARRLVLDG